MTKTATGRSQDSRRANSGPALPEPCSRARPAVLPTARDIELLRLIGEQYMLSLPQVARAIGRSEHTARWLRRRLERAGFLRGRALTARGPTFLWLTARGLAAAGLELRPWQPRSLGRIAHICAVTEARLEVARRRPQATWIPERALWRERARAKGPRVHMPDAEVLVDDACVAVEVELTQKQRSRTERIARELQAHYDAVWYLAAPAPRRALDALAKRHRWQRVQVLALPEEARGS